MSITLAATSDRIRIVGLSECGESSLFVFRLIGEKELNHACVICILLLSKKASRSDDGAAQVLAPSAQKLARIREPLSALKKGGKLRRAYCGMSHANIESKKDGYAPVLFG